MFIMTKISGMISLVAIEIFELFTRQNLAVALYTSNPIDFFAHRLCKDLLFSDFHRRYALKSFKFAFISYLVFSSSSRIHYPPRHLGSVPALAHFLVCTLILSSIGNLETDSDYGYSPAYIDLN
jgi:hypothetical protein